ncbi:uncharacterized protein STEHIDRAFT_68450 [Stereum hirsutum FP-91666 SS1]|uniref:Uncharacterized protein n=1 Tax=Stereum hirsutum (strain FP-91666) TaxID=721885 RepID=R7RYQ6_STEHR|nr:uncharacterized protein STEHIDRAFT_68450 [Stereum hirsutum FP-91666 SS1]EIM80531.1 hypothetical protein STEHIDRAFT_68450 [Stereum hirsutum FP-91666 SS1]
MQTQEATYPDAPVQATDSDDDITFVKTVKPIRIQSCPGHILTFPPRQTPNSSYPFMLHDQMDLPWDYQSCGTIMILRASSCTGKALYRQACCSCSELENNYNLIVIKYHIKHGVHKNSPFAYHGLGGMIEVARRKGRQNEYLRFKKVNMVKKLAGRTGKISKYKQMVLALSDKRIPCLNSLLRVARR